MVTQDPVKRAAIIARFWGNVDKREAKACWLWIGYLNTKRYGQFYALGRLWRANRLAWMFTRGDIPTGMEVCHTCDNPTCVNPDHLFLGSRRDNHLDSVRKGRMHVYGTQKLDAQQVCAIRARAGRGENRNSIAADFGISASQVTKIVHRKRWAHLECVGDGTHTRQKSGALLPAGRPASA